jgi:hypothetical protein
MRMGNIFGQAISLCIWLGDVTGGSDDAMQFIDEILL